MVNLVIQSYGRESEYRRAILAILSYFAHTSVSFDNTRVIFFTDKPGYFYEYLDGLPIDYRLLTPEKIKQMRGEIDFVHRMKIAMIEEAFQLVQGTLLYFDSDTFFISDPTPLVNQVDESKSFMHACEYKFRTLSNELSGPAKVFYGLIHANKFLLNSNRNMIVSLDSYSWNAGVMILHNSVASLLDDVYSLTDQFFLGSQSHASEQYAFSIMLQQNTYVEPCEDKVYHYWQKVKKVIIDRFLENKVDDLNSLSLVEKINLVKQWTLFLPDYFDKHLLTLQEKAITAFGESKFMEGYWWAFKALIKNPTNQKRFVKDVMYYTKVRVLK